jgi:Zn-dependent protease
MSAASVGPLALFAALVLIAITFHEAAHAYVASFLGDDTARKSGRVSLNPLRHVDPVGTLLLPAMLIFAHASFIFGYAKPVPVTWSALGRPKRDMMLVAAAGPAANVILGIVSSLAAYVAARSGSTGYWLFGALSLSARMNFLLAVLNLIPIPPLDGSKIVAGLLPDKIAVPYLRLGRFGALPFLLLIVVFVLLRTGLPRF